MRRANDLLGFSQDGKEPSVIETVPLTRVCNGYLPALMIAALIAPHIQDEGFDE